MCGLTGKVIRSFREMYGPPSLHENASKCDDPPSRDKVACERPSPEIRT